MKKFLNRFIHSKMLKCFLMIFIGFMLIEIIFRSISAMSIFSWEFLRITTGLIILSIFFSLILSFVNRKIRYIIATLLIGAFSLYAYLQLGFNIFIGVYMSVNTTSQLGAVKDYIIDFLHSLPLKYYLVYIPFILAIAYSIFTLIKFDEKTNKIHLKSTLRKENGIKVCLSGIFIILLGLFYSFTLTTPIMQNELQAIPNKSLFKYPSVPSIAVQNFGIIGFCLDDFKTLFVEYEEEPIVYAMSQTEPQENSREFDDTAWEDVIANEKSKQLNQINEFLIKNRSTNTNEYTGLFEGKNVIFIMMESVGEMFINKEYYPNFYKMYTDGYTFVNHYSPRNACATGNNEFSGITGLYSIYNNCTANIYKNNKYPESIFNLFNNAGYKTVSMHDYTEAYYYRKTQHPNYGSMKYYGVEDLGIDYQNVYVNWADDEDFAKSAMKIVLDSGDYDDNPFMLWMTTVSSHQPYSTKSITGTKYESIFKKTKYSFEIKQYLSKLKIVDEMLGILMDKLEAKGILDDTVFVMYGDHYPYGLPLEKINEVLDYNLDDYENERTPFVIYNSATEGKDITKYTSYINLTPTVANLFGLNFDPRLYMGEDVLDDSYQSKVVFADGSWKNDAIYYNAKTGKTTNYKDNEYTSSDIVNINREISTKMNMSSAIIKNDYFNYLNKALAETQERIETANKEEE